jgi:predicted DNA-binding transcriptional regulator YafY
MLSTSTRVLQLLVLLQTRRDWSGAELASRLGVGPRTVRRDLDRLRALGYVIESTRGVAGGYRLGAGAAMPPLLLDDEEATAVAVGLRTAASGSVGELEDAALRALVKLERILPAVRRRRVVALTAATLTLPTRGELADPAVLVALAEAVRDRVSVRFEYRDEQKRASRRRVEPHRLVHTGRRWYLLAYDLDREAWRTLRVDRIQRLPTTDRRFAERPPPEADVAAYVSRAITMTPYPYQTRAIVQLPAADVEARIGPTVGWVEVLDETTCAVHTGATSLEELGAYLGMLGAPFTIDGPPALRAHLATLAERYARACT